MQAQMRKLLAGFVILGWVAVAAEAAGPGLEVGQPAPDFSLQDQHGKQQKLSELVTEGPVAIVFFRSADW